MNNNRVHISIVSPVYQAQGCLNELYKRLRSSLESITKDFEIILIEDCGNDRSWDLIIQLAKNDSRVKGLQFSRNFGQHHGITAGLDICKGNWVIIMDCDLQDRPEEIPRLYQKALEGYDVVVAKRGKRKHTVLKRFTSWLFYKVFNYLIDMKYDGEVGVFRIISKKVVNNFRLMREQHRYFGGLVNWMGFHTASIEVTHDKRFQGESSYNFKKLFKFGFDTIIAYSDKPLKLFSSFGFIISFISFIFGVYLFFNAAFFGSSVVGWSSLIVSIYFMGGIIIGVLGLIGIYLGKTFNETKKRPLYIIAKTTDKLKINANNNIDCREAMHEDLLGV